MSSTLTTDEQKLDVDQGSGSSGSRKSKSAEAQEDASSKRTMTDEHKAAIAAGRLETAAVNEYLNAMESIRPRPGRKQTPEKLQDKLLEIDAALSDGSSKPINRLLLIQERREVEQTLVAMQDQPDMATIEAEFVKYAAGFSERKGIDYATWREAGVPADVLTRAGISRSRS